MKKIISIFLLFSFLSGAVFAQENSDDYESGTVKTGFNNDNHSEFYLGVGTPSFAAACVDMFNTIVDSIGKDKKASESDYPSYGTYRIGFDYYFNFPLVVGAYANIEPLAKYDTTLISLLAKAGVMYGPSKVKFYHEFSAGTGIATNKPANPFLMINLAYFGIKISANENFGFYFDLDFGTCGFANAGIIYRF